MIFLGFCVKYGICQGLQGFINGGLGSVAALDIRYLAESTASAHADSAAPEKACFCTPVFQDAKSRSSLNSFVETAVYNAVDCRFFRG